jgi:hypothetical protein
VADDYSLDLIDSVSEQVWTDSECLSLFDVVLRGPHVDYFDLSERTATSAFDPRLSTA